MLKWVHHKFTYNFIERLPTYLPAAHEGSATLTKLHRYYNTNRGELAWARPSSLCVLEWHDNDSTGG